VSFYYIRVAKHFQTICTLIGNKNLILHVLRQSTSKGKKSRPIRDLGFLLFRLFRRIPRTTHLIYKFHRVQYLRNIVAMPLLPKNLKNALYACSLTELNFVLLVPHRPDPKGLPLSVSSPRSIPPGFRNSSPPDQEVRHSYQRSSSPGKMVWISAGFSTELPRSTR
jgi:hypothetical protein